MVYIRRSPVWPDPRVKPPFGAVEVDRAHPLAQSLAWYYGFQEGAGPAVDLITGFRFSTGSHTWKPTVKGIAASFDGTSDGFNADDLGSSYTLPYSIAALAIPFSVSATAANITSGGIGGLYSWQLRRDTAQWSFYHADTGDNLASEPGGVVAGIPAFLVGTWDGADIRLYRDGGLKATTAVANMRNGQAWHIGYDNFGAPQRWDGEIVWVGWWKERVLTSADVTALFAEPYRFLRPIIRRRWFTALGGQAPRSMAVTRMRRR